MVTFEETMLDIAWKNCEMTDRHRKDVETKASLLLTVTLILISAFNLKFLELSKTLPLYLKLVFAFAMLTIFSTLLCGFYALFPKTQEYLSIQELIYKLPNMQPPEHRVRGIIATLARVQDSYIEPVNKSAEALRWGFFSLVISVYLLSAFLAVLLFLP